MMLGNILITVPFLADYRVQVRSILLLLLLLLLLLFFSIRLEMFDFEVNV